MKTVTRDTLIQRWRREVEKEGLKLHVNRGNVDGDLGEAYTTLDNAVIDVYTNVDDILKRDFLKEDEEYTV